MKTAQAVLRPRAEVRVRLRNGIGIVFTTLALGLAGCSGPSATSAGPETAGSEPKGGGSKPPDFELSALDGSSVRLSDHLGKEVILVDFWATFCDPCMAAMPHLDELYKKHKAEGLLILGVSIDGPDSVAQVKATVGEDGRQLFQSCSIKRRAWSRSTTRRPAHPSRC